MLFIYVVLSRMKEGCKRKCLRFYAVTSVNDVENAFQVRGAAGSNIDKV